MLVTFSSLLCTGVQCLQLSMTLRPMCHLSLLLAACTGLGQSQSRNCTLEHVEPALPYRVESVSEHLGDWRFTCTGFGPRPTDVLFFFDAPFANQTGTINGRQVTSAMAIVEGTTPETVVFQVPGDPPTPNANAFLMEFIDNRLGPHLFVSGVPGNVPLVISGVRGNIAAGASARLGSTQNGPTLGVSVSKTDGAGGDFDQLEVIVVEALDSNVGPEQSGPLEFRIPFKEPTPSGFRSPEQSNGLAAELAESGLPEETPTSLLPDTGQSFMLAFWAGFDPPNRGAIKLLVVAQDRGLFDTSPNVLSRDDGSAAITPSPDGTALASFRVEEDFDPNTIDELVASAQIECPEPVVLNGPLIIRTTLGPTTEDNLLLLLAPGLPPPDPPSSLPHFEAPIIERVIEFDNVPCGSAQVPTITSAIVNGANFGIAVPPGGVATIAGERFSPITRRATSIGQNTIGETGLSFSVDGLPTGNQQNVQIPAPLFFVSPNQINFQVPWEVGGGSGAVSLVVRNQDGESEPLMVELPELAPALFTFDFGPGRAVAIHSTDGALAHTPDVLAGLGLAGRVAQPGDFLLLLGTGFGPTNPPGITGDDSLDDQGGFIQRDLVSQPRVLIGGVEAPVFFAGLSPQFMGVNQLNIEVPQGVEPGDRVSLVVEQAGVRSPEDVTISVGP